MNIITINNTVIPNILVINDDDIPLSDQTNKLIVNIRQNTRNVTCYEVLCTNCPLEHLCTDAETAGKLKESTIKEFFPTLKEDFPEYFI